MIKKTSNSLKVTQIWNIRMLDLMGESIMREEFKSEKDWFKKIGFTPANKPGLLTGERSFTIPQMIKAAKLHKTTLDYICGLTDVRHDAGKKISAVQLIEEGLRMLKENKNDFV